MVTLKGKSARWLQERLKQPLSVEQLAVFERADKVYVAIQPRKKKEELKK